MSEPTLDLTETPMEMYPDRDVCMAHFIRTSISHTGGDVHPYADICPWCLLERAERELGEVRLLAADLLNQACSRALEDGTMVVDDFCMSTYEGGVDYFRALGWLTDLADGRNLQQWTDVFRAAAD